MSIDFSILGEKEISKLVLESSPQKLTSVIPFLSPRQFQIAVSVLLESSPQHLAPIFQAVQDPLVREVGANSLTSEGFLWVINYLQSKETLLLIDLIKYLPNPVFSEALCSSNFNLKLIKQCIHQEPLLHQLTLFTHRMEEKLTLFQQQARTMENEIKGLDPLTMHHLYLEELQNQIDKLQEDVNEMIYGISNALNIAWNTTRKDLIMNLSRLKEMGERFLYEMGISVNPPPTSLNQLFLARIGSVYTGSLKDEDPAIEALACLRILDDTGYQEVGLFDQSANHKGKILEIVGERLAQLGLHTVSDVKKARICSCETLRHFISQKKIKPGNRH